MHLSSHPKMDLFPDHPPAQEGGDFHAYPGAKFFVDFHNDYVHYENYPRGLFDRSRSGLQVC